MTARVAGSCLMQIERLRLVGFKSFVDATELAVEPGLTGIVGPNGCGKSNLVEALRWVMGEASARRLRGGEMDDVIFAGSGGRPARNIAEVVLTLDNSSRSAPFAFNEREAIEVVRRIDRGSGSSYRINGREARARDVQLLFSDAATGAHSGAIVGQGRIGALIAARPADRRALLDEAAGTAGLHARRHEAELKLKAAEDNLARVDDVIVTLAQQLDGLKKQARQAERYRRLAEQIRRAEAQLFAARWREAAAESERLSAELHAAEREVAGATAQALAEERSRAEAEAVLPALRLAEASESASVQRLAHARTALESELTRLVAARGEADRRMAQLGADLDREDENLADAETALSRIAAERQQLGAGDDQSERARREAAAQLEQAGADLAAAEIGLQQMTEAGATGEARRAVLERRLRELGERRERLGARLIECERQRAALDLVPPEMEAATSRGVEDAAAAVEAARALADRGADTLSACQASEAEAVEAARTADSALGRLTAEADALASLVAGPPSGESAETPILASLRVPEGFEAAVAALFGDELAAPLLDQGREDSAVGWVDLGPLGEPPVLPEGAHPLTADLATPRALARRLSQTGWVDSASAGWALQPQLGPGQSLVDREGRHWRWDGFARLSPGSSAVAQQLRQRNRLAALTGEIATSRETAEGAAETAAAARRAREQAATEARAAVAALRAAEEQLARTRTVAAELAGRALSARTRFAAFADTEEKLRAELGEAAAETGEAERSLALLPNPGLARAGLEAARAQASAARRREAEARTALDRLTAEVAARQRRLAALAEDEISWQRRRDRSGAQRAALVERRATAAAEIAELAARPTAIATESEALARQAALVAADHRAASDALSQGETRLRHAAESTRRAEQALTEARERRARFEAQRDGATDTLARLRAELRDRLDAAPEDLAEIDEGGEPGDTAARLDRLTREREAIGPVNLVAESEAAEVEARIAELQREGAELTEAIARLRRGIATLDQEARKRLVEAFERLNTHFGELFARLFGGGKAHLALTDAADPLDAGLEIMASPPGKRLQVLSLLSGGEQALTAIALIFAVFLTNPAPICVLDEVDAPLDDANVDRFCRLVADIADNTGTRFLLITHHRITMARVDRLFGVTMPERGVSQLVSVDLARAAELRRTA